MSGFSRQAHWENVYATKSENEVSWFEESPTISLDLILATGATPTTSIIDIGGSASRLVDALIAAGYEQVTVSSFPRRHCPTRGRDLAGRPRR